MKKEIKKQIQIKNKQKIDYKWIIKITLLAFVISIVFSSLSESFVKNVNIFVAVLILIIFIFIGILFDMIGVAVTSADEGPFHSMSSRKVKGAKLAVKFKQNADKVSSFCNDVIGDICGVVSGSCCITIATNLSNSYNFNYLLCSLIVTSIVSALTIGGKAIGKNIAINKSDIILYKFCLFIEHFWKVK